MDLGYVPFLGYPQLDWSGVSYGSSLVCGACLFKL